jgi:hypothetical protein
MLHPLGDVQVIPQKSRLVCGARVRVAGCPRARLASRPEGREPALYAAKVTVDRGSAGQGAERLDRAATRAADEGADGLPVEMWTTNEHLQH